MSSNYKDFPTEGVVPVGSYQTRFGRVWVSKAQPEYIHDTVDTGHYEDRYTTELEGVGNYFPALVTVEVIVEAFEERNREWRIEDRLRW